MLKYTTTTSKKKSTLIILLLIAPFLTLSLVLGSSLAAKAPYTDGKGEAFEKSFERPFVCSYQTRFTGPAKYYYCAPKEKIASIFNNPILISFFIFLLSIPWAIISVILIVVDQVIRRRAKN